MQSVNISEFATDLLGRYKKEPTFFRLIHWRLHSDRRWIWHCHEIFIDAADRFSFRPVSRKYFRSTYIGNRSNIHHERVRSPLESPATRVPSLENNFYAGWIFCHPRRYVYGAFKTQGAVCSKSVLHILSLFIASAICRGNSKRDSKEGFTTASSSV